jgi:hypothetical protein
MKPIGCQRNDEHTATKLVKEAGFDSLPVGKARLACAAKLRSNIEVAQGSPLNTEQMKKHEDLQKILMSYGGQTRSPSLTPNRHSLVPLSPEKRDIRYLLMLKVETNDTSPIVQAVFQGILLTCMPYCLHMSVVLHALAENVIHCLGIVHT